MKQKNLKSLSDETLIYMNWFLEFMIRKNESTNILSRSEISIIKNWQKKIRETI